MPRVLFVFVIAAFLGGCSGGSGGSRPPVTVAPLPTASAPAPGSTATHAAAAHFTITIPAATAASTRRAAYLSSATQSVVITLTAVNGVPFTGSPSEVASNLTPSNPNCSGTPLTCTVAVPGFTGTDTFAIGTYDAQQPATLAATPAGNLLSQATLTATVVANAINTVAVVLNGVPASITIAGLPSGTAGTPLAAQPFVVMVDDAAGRTIVGAFANPVVLSDGDTSGATTVATSGSDSPPAGQLLSSSDVASVSYTGLAIAPVNIGASAPNATANTANFAPALQPIVTTAPLNGATPEVALTMSSATQSFGASEIGWTNAPYNKTLSVTATGACSTIGSVSPASGTSFTATVAGSPAAGTCTLAVTDFPGGSAFTVTLAYVTGTQNYGSPGTSNFTVPFGVSQVTIAAAGGQGHGGGGGGSVTATIPVTAGETLAVYVGGASGGGGGGINGGGNSGGDGCGSGGGGASDVRQGGSALTNRVVVAGGGGGGGCDNGYGGGGGGAGGGSTGGAGQTVTTAGGGVGGSGGASGVGGAGGAGGVGTVNGGNAGSGVLGTGGVGGLGGGGSFTGLGGSGGGGGYYGGGGGGGGAGNCCGSPGIGGGGGAGGSSYVEPGGTTITNVAGTQGGDGQVIVSW